MENANKSIVGMVVALAIMVGLALSSFSLFEQIDAGEILVVQSPTGKLKLHTSPGIKYQGFGKVTIYKKREQFWFDSTKGNEKDDESIRIRFNDGAHATISGSVAWEMPLDDSHLILLHTKYGTHQAVEQQLIKTVIEKSIYMTGPLMSSAESYATKRNHLLYFIEDQAERGIYRTVSRDEHTKDPLTGAEKTVKVVELVRGTNTADYEREAESSLSELGLKLFNLSINEVRYDPEVEKQIQNQQKAIMDVQTAIAKAKTAEQDAITTMKQGEADAAKAKWAQEVIKATQVTEAQQKLEVMRLNAEADRTNAWIAAQKELDVAKLKAQAAQQEKIATTLIGEGESARRKLVMDADGALEKKLEAWVKVNTIYAEAIRGYSGAWVPSVVMGGQSGSSVAGGGAMDFINLLMAKTANDLSLDLKSTNSPAKK